MDSIKTQIFRCIRHKKQIKSKGENSKGCQRYSGCGCASYFRVNLSQRGVSKGLYKITGMKIDHNHDTTQENYLFHPRNRKIPENLKTVAKEMVETGSKAASVALLLSNLKLNQFKDLEKDNQKNLEYFENNWLN